MITLLLVNELSRLTCMLYFQASACRPNIALGGNVTMSSLYTSTTHGDGTWAYAVDGITDQDWYTGGCASSNREANPWLLLDLGGPFTVTALKIYNRGDGSYGKDVIRGMQYTKGYNVGWF